MKYSVLSTVFVLAISLGASAQQYKVITIVESFSAAGTSFSKIVDTAESLNATDGYSEHGGESEANAAGMRPSAEKAREMEKEKESREAMSREDRAKAATKEAPASKNDRKASKKVTKFNEVGLHNLGGANGGINPLHLSSNDAVISAKMTEMAMKGWTLSHVGTVVEGEGQNRILVSRLYFFKAKK